MGNNLLIKAQVAKKDEFYTQYSDIENELKFYEKKFKNKIVYCNCDNPKLSEFNKYFILNFHKLKLKKLICTGFNEPKGFKFETNGNDFCKENALNYFENLEVEFLKGNGDFQNTENINILKTANIIVTNPPFSLFKEFTEQLFKYKKQFLIIGNMNAFTYKNIFLRLKNNEIWSGVNFNKGLYFKVPQDYDFKKTKFIKSQLIRVPAISWFTNIKTDIELKFLKLTNSIKNHKYKKFDNYNAINIDKTKNIPCDYFGVMGVPLSFLEKYNSKQFRLIGHEHDINGNLGKGINEGQFEIEKKGQFKRILIQRNDINYDDNYFLYCQNLINENSLNINCVNIDYLTAEEYLKLCFKSVENSQGKSLNLIIFQALENQQENYFKLCQKALSFDKENIKLVNFEYLNTKQKYFLIQFNTDFKIYKKEKKIEQFNLF